MIKENKYFGFEVLELKMDPFMQSALKLIWTSSLKGLTLLSIVPSCMYVKLVRYM